ncbi:CGNR zinc finger domain-containing protein [Nonomuraea angiospora]|uniref:CGNR zinc finger domain-containing protein n=1 Tax=Nonomuraea angiospora TaxID=46172 RepID=UPI00344C7A17
MLAQPLAGEAWCALLKPLPDIGDGAATPSAGQAAELPARGQPHTVLIDVTCERRPAGSADRRAMASAAGRAADQAARINAMIRRYGAQPYLVDDVGQPFHLHFHGSGGTQVEALGGEFATAPALVVDGYGHDRFGECEAVYIDLTRNASRRHCSTACTARAKTAAYRSRRQP